MIDEAFMPFREIVVGLLAFRGEIADDARGIRSVIYGCDVDSPVELDISRNEAGELQIGTTPPLYRVDTSLQPSWHRLRITAELEEEEHDGRG